VQLLGDPITGSRASTHGSVYRCVPAPGNEMVFMKEKNNNKVEGYVVKNTRRQIYRRETRLILTFFLNWKRGDSGGKMMKLVMQGSNYRVQDITALGKVVN